jgi:hypothetical protein
VQLLHGNHVLQVVLDERLQRHVSLCDQHCFNDGNFVTVGHVACHNAHVLGRSCPAGRWEHLPPAHALPVIFLLGPCAALAARKAARGLAVSTALPLATFLSG